MDEREPPPASLKCPNCGGDANPGDVRCSWCQGSLATLACPSCFATIFVGMKHCPWCGTEVAKAEVLAQSPANCPHCGTGMRWVELGGSQLNECETCGGIWVGTESFEKICQDREQQEAVLGRPDADIQSPDTGGQTPSSLRSLPSLPEAHEPHEFCRLLWRCHRLVQGPWNLAGSRRAAPNHRFHSERGAKEGERPGERGPTG